MVTRTIAAVVLALSGSAGFAATTPATSSKAATATDFGIRTVGGSASATPAAASGSASSASWTPVSRAVNMQAIAALGARWGTVTSTYRSPAHNRRVGGVRNSYHTRNRAIDIARRAGVSHAQIAAAYRSAGYQLIESLDEGDHSHFAFGTGSRRATVVQAAERKPTEVTAWRVVTAPGALR